MHSKAVRDRKRMRLVRRNLPSWYRRAITIRLAKLGKMRTLDLSDNPDVRDIEMRTRIFHTKIAEIRDEIRKLQTTRAALTRMSKKQFQFLYPGIVLP